jgi:5-oxopent-3-ene-1,2,5-tricarboxylate decarboxylase/2-hydroxyhepta-2,4-diene-1,7-dioate isomerase
VEFRAPQIETPTYFQKPTTALNSHRGSLVRPKGTKYLNYEGEVAVIIGKPMRNVRREEAWEYIAGFAPGNDAGSQDFRETDAGSMLRVKGQKGFVRSAPVLSAAWIYANPSSVPISTARWCRRARLAR